MEPSEYPSIEVVSWPVFANFVFLGVDSICLLFPESMAILKTGVPFELIFWHESDLERLLRQINLALQ